MSCWILLCKHLFVGEVEAINVVSHTCTYYAFEIGICKVNLLPFNGTVFVVELRILSKI